MYEDVDDLKRYEPIDVSPPGHTLRDILQERRISCRSAARRLGISQKFLSDLIKGKEKLDSYIAHKLSQEFGVSYDFWLGLEKRYCDSLIPM